MHDCLTMDFISDGRFINPRIAFPVSESIHMWPRWKWGVRSEVKAPLTLSVDTARWWNKSRWLSVLPFSSQTAFMCQWSGWVNQGKSPQQSAGHFPELEFYLRCPACTTCSSLHCVQDSRGKLQRSIPEPVCEEHYLSWHIVRKIDSIVHQLFFGQESDLKTTVKIA